MLLRKDGVNGQRFFSAEAVQNMQTNQIASIGASAALGWELDRPHFMGKLRTRETFGKTGFTGTSCVVDRAKGVACVILSNQTYPKRPVDRSSIDVFRCAIADAVFSAP